MTWLTWRQFRTQSWITIGGLAAVGVVLVITGRSIAEAYASANVAGCGEDCAEAFGDFLRRAMTSTPQAVYDLTRGLAYVLPALIGIFWGAPLIARELETGTHRLVWNQSITRTRWLATKLGIIGAATVATTGLLSLAITTWAKGIDVAAGDRITPLVYGARGIVPIGYAIFAFMLGVTCGMLIRRTVPGNGRHAGRLRCRRHLDPGMDPRTPGSSDPRHARTRHVHAGNTHLGSRGRRDLHRRQQRARKRVDPVQ